MAQVKTKIPMALLEHTRVLQVTLKSKQSLRCLLITALKTWGMRSRVCLSLKISQPRIKLITFRTQKERSKLYSTIRLIRMEHVFKIQIQIITSPLKHQTLRIRRHQAAALPLISTQWAVCLSINLKLTLRSMRTSPVPLRRLIKQDWIT